MSASNAVDSISMVLPAYNEEANIALAVERADAALEATGVEAELIVVDDGSRDGTDAILRGLCERFGRLRVVRLEPNQGYGGALRAGFSAARCDWIFQSDSDNQFDYRELARLIPHAERADFVAGYRSSRSDPFQRRLNGWAWNLLIAVLFGRVVRDIDCAFRLFRRQILDDVHLESNGAMISTELLVGTKTRGFRIAEVAVTHLPREGGHPTGAHPIVILKAFRDLLRYRIELGRPRSTRASLRTT
jgi:glycosyltransferase involved in cell wall biosynthesis